MTCIISIKDLISRTSAKLNPVSLCQITMNINLMMCIICTKDLMPAIMAPN